MLFYIGATAHLGCALKRGTLPKKNKKETLSNGKCRVVTSLLLRPYAACTEPQNKLLYAASPLGKKMAICLFVSFAGQKPFGSICKYCHVLLNILAIFETYCVTF